MEWLTADDMDCRALQFEQVFVDLGDGQPAARDGTCMQSCGTAAPHRPRVMHQSRHAKALLGYRFSDQAPGFAVRREIPMANGAQGAGE